ncbi:hypothetical protein J6590_068663 [Homalodisca vitripennis]|nr:hypothetical protein J6590_068663 [Homalodisca vitripennis]
MGKPLGVGDKREHRVINLSLTQEQVHCCRQTKWEAAPEGTWGKVACQDDSLQLSCNPHSRVVAYSASFGRTEYESVHHPKPQGVRQTTYATETVMLNVLVCLATYATETVMLSVLVCLATYATETVMLSVLVCLATYAIETVMLNVLLCLATYATETVMLNVLVCLATYATETVMLNVLVCLATYATETVM